MNTHTRAAFTAELSSALDHLATARSMAMDGYDLDDHGSTIDHAEAVGAIILLEHAIQHLRDHWGQNPAEVTAAP